ncbi:MAG TPA: ABC transporter permease [Anaerolineaceae bacterium]|nr:ABC transporter permease [Anaerolineaceae bacterium]
MNEAFVISILVITIRAGTSLLYATFGAILTERSGIQNLGVEGIMMVGAAASFAVAYHSNSVWLGLAGAVLVGVILGCIHAFLTITLRAEQVVSGLAMTIFGTGLASFMGQRLGPGGTTMVGLQGAAFKRLPVPILREIPYIGEAFFNQDIMVYFLYLLIPLIWLYLYKTRQGLELRAVGENPQAIDALGMDVTKMRFIYTVVGAIFMAVAGAHLSLGYLQGWADNITGGRGWIAIALVIFATWNPLRAVLGALLFGGINAIQFRMQAAGTTLPSSFLNMLPYIVTIVVLVIITWAERRSKKLGTPSALGIPFVREEKK